MTTSQTCEKSYRCDILGVLTLIKYRFYQRKWQKRTDLITTAIFIIIIVLVIVIILTLSPRYDELSISYGDVINIHDKQEDDWWLGECGGKVGIFPATYVEQI